MIEELNRILEAQMRIFIQESEAVLKQELKKKKLQVSGELFDSFDARIIKSASDGLAEVAVDFAKHGRIKDMRNVSYTNQPPVLEIQKWVEKIGVSRFKYIPGYENSRPQTESQAANRIAWGISLNKKKADKVKSKSWYNKLMWSEINKLEQNLSEYFVNNIREDLKKFLKQ